MNEVHLKEDGCGDVKIFTFADYLIIECLTVGELREKDKNMNKLPINHAARHEHETRWTVYDIREKRCFRFYSKFTAELFARKAGDHTPMMVVPARRLDANELWHED
ncbi:MAG: hypothetical protein V3U58_03850 [Thermodesulfobacteriota bacterium]